MKKYSDIGLIGLAVMGENLALNMERNGFVVSVYNRNEGNEIGVVDNFINGRGKDRNFQGFTDINTFVESLSRPRKIMMMIRAGAPVDMVIQQLLPYLEDGDIVIDGGNSNYEDTERRFEYLKEKNIHFVGMGISGGEEGALNGPSIMPGGSAEAWPHIKDIYQKIAAKADDGTPCCSWIGSGGSGHFVKMVHNGIEYGDMQLIAESYGFMRCIDGVGNDMISEVFSKWNTGKLNSYLVEISANILKFRDDDGNALIDKILDKAGQKGTGKWSVIASMEYATPLNLICSAVYERCISSLKDQRIRMSRLYSMGNTTIPYDEEIFDKLHDSLYASKLISYAQGFALMYKVSQEKGWDLNMSDIAKVWRSGCIIRSQFLDDISKAFERNGNLDNLLLDDYFKHEILTCLENWKYIVSLSISNGIAVPAFSSAINYFHSISSESLPANMLQAQRDYFGAHTFERVDRPSGEFFHVNWTGHGGDTSSTTYNN